jgi:hypothetical protein
VGLTAGKQHRTFVIYLYKTVGGSVRGDCDKAIKRLQHDTHSVRLVLEGCVAITAILAETAGCCSPSQGFSETKEQNYEHMAY